MLVCVCVCVFVCARVRELSGRQHAILLPSKSERERARECLCE